MKKYRELTKIGAKIALAYKFDFIVSIFTVPISIIVFYFLWKTIYAYSGLDVIRGYTFEEMVNYFIMSMVIALLGWSNIERVVEYDVLYGEMVLRLLSPVTYLASLFYTEMGLKAMSLLVEATPIFLIGIVFFKAKVFSILNLILYAIAVLFSIGLVFLISFLIGLSSFWLKRISGISRSKKLFLSFLGGGFVPLTFFPKIFQQISEWLPFQYIRYVPINIYLGKYSTFLALEMIGRQIIWIILLYIIAKILWNRAIRKFCGVGV